jgi:hypothetical protein
VEGSCKHGNDIRVPYNFGKFFSSCTTGDLSKRAQFNTVSYSKIYYVMKYNYVLKCLTASTAYC